MIGAGTIISPIIKVVTTVAVLAAIYFLIVRPILDTTENVTNEAFNSFNNGSGSGSGSGSQEPTEATINAERQAAQSYANSLLAGTQPWPEASKAVLTCIKKAGDSVPKLDKCESFGQSIAHGTLSDRNFAVSYADNLETQGKTSEAAQVRDCVEKAGYEEKPMEKCRKLADQLLF